MTTAPPAPPATRQMLLDRLAALGIAVTTIDHAAVFTVEDARAVHGTLQGGHCKNLFLKDEKGRLWLLVALDDAAIDLKAAAGVIGSAKLSFGKPELLRATLGVEPGSVTPFAVINDPQASVSVILDSEMMAQEKINVHPLINTASTTIIPADLVRFLEACGHRPRTVRLPGRAL